MSPCLSRSGLERIREPAIPTALLRSRGSTSHGTPRDCVLMCFALSIWAVRMKDPRLRVARLNLLKVQAKEVK